MNQPSPYAPTSADPLRMAALTTKAVDQIGEAAAAEIEQAAAAVLKEAEDIAAKLRRMADAFREQTKIASAAVNEFCGRSTHLLETLQAPPAEPDRLPSVVLRGPNGHAEG